MLFLHAKTQGGWAPLRPRKEEKRPPAEGAEPCRWEKALVKAECKEADSPRDCCAMAVTSAALSPSRLPKAPRRCVFHLLCSACSAA